MPELASSFEPTNVYLNQKLDDHTRRERIFAGDIFFFFDLKTAQALCAYAERTLQEAFETDDPTSAHHRMPVEEFVRRATSAKSRFTNSLEAKELLRDYAMELGTPVNEYYFDLPRLRIVPHYDYLHAGVSYAYAAHRDTWYGGPSFQINHWMPVRSISPDQTMAIYPGYFRRSIKNSSRDFDLDYWVTTERAKAPANIASETRTHPVPLEPIDEASAIRFAGAAGALMTFSGAHLHATVPNRTASTRFSVDFRFFHVDDIRRAGPGMIRPPENVDSEARSKDFGIRHLIHLGDFSPYPEQDITA